MITLAQAHALLQWARCQCLKLAARMSSGEANFGRNVFGANCKCRATPKTYTKKMLSGKGLKMSKIW